MLISLFQNVPSIKSCYSGIVDEYHLEKTSKLLKFAHWITITGANIDDDIMLRLQINDNYASI